MPRRETSGLEVMASLALLNRSGCPGEYRRMLAELCRRTGCTPQEAEQRIEALAGRRGVA